MKLHKIANNTYEFTLNKNISKEDLGKMTAAFQEFQEREEQVNLLCILQSAPSLDIILAINELFKLKLKGFKVMHKYAVLADKDWIEKLIPIANFLTPGLPIQTFSMDKKEDAIQWLTQLEVKEYKPEEYLTEVDIEKLNATSYMISLNNKVVDHAAMSALNAMFSNLNNEEKINLMVVFNNIPSMESFKTYIEGLKVNFKIFGRLAKYAIVSDAKWIEAYSKVGDFLTPGIEISTFSNTEMEKAKAWMIS